MPFPNELFGELQTPFAKEASAFGKGANAIRPY